MFEIFKKKKENIVHEHYEPRYLFPLRVFGQECWLKFINEITRKSINKEISVEDKELSDIQYWTSLGNNECLKVNVAAYMYLELSNRLARIESLLDRATKSKNGN